ncbi:MAG: hypothetical protein LH471_07645 [Salinibacterium sp.]|nr:hypothetical protein [Salinibacterium sp.]
MNILDRELKLIVQEAEAPLIDLEQLERLVTADDLHLFDGECAAHDGCRPIIARVS